MASQYNTNLFSIVPIGNHVRATSLASATTITIPNNATGLLLQAEDQSVNFVFGSASTPTADNGFLIRAGDPSIRLDLFPGSVVRVIEVVIGASVNYQFFRSV